MSSPSNGTFLIVKYRATSELLMRACTVMGTWEPAAKRARLEVVSHQETSVHAVSAKLEWRIDHFEKLMKLFRNGQNIISKQASVVSPFIGLLTLC